MTTNDTLIIFTIIAGRCFREDSCYFAFRINVNMTRKYDDRQKSGAAYGSWTDTRTLFFLLSVIDFIFDCSETCSPNEVADIKQN